MAGVRLSLLRALCTFLSNTALSQEEDEFYESEYGESSDTSSMRSATRSGRSSTGR